MTYPRADAQVANLDAIPQEHLLSFLELTHELRSPLGMILNAVDVILQGYADNDHSLQDDLLGRVRERTQLMIEQVDDFFRLAAVRYDELSRRVEPVQLVDVIAQLAPDLRLRARWRSVGLSFELPDNLPRIGTSAQDMEHLVSNLVLNAIKYTDPGGNVTVALRQEDDCIVCHVADDGIGIAEDEITRIFDEFYRAENARESGVVGTGLGLAIVKRIVDRYDGSLTVESELGRGSTFSFSFPALSDES